MGVLIDTGVLIECEQDPKAIDFAAWDSYGAAYVSVVALSELAVGAWRASNEQRRQERLAYFEYVIQNYQVVNVDLAIARLHAQLVAELLIRGTPVGTHDLWIAATARHFQFAVLTTNVKDFARVPGIHVLDANSGGTTKEAT